MGQHQLITEIQKTLNQRYDGLLTAKETADKIVILINAYLIRTEAL